MFWICSVHCQYVVQTPLSSPIDAIYCIGDPFDINKRFYVRILYRDTTEGLACILDWNQGKFGYSRNRPKWVEISVKIIRAKAENLDELAGLFDQYRQFYEQAPGLEACRAFMAERIENDESVIFAAQSDEGFIIGFTQLYRSFCSVELKELIYLYDLFVAPTARRTGAARALMEAARQYASARGADRLTLETAITNRAAQALYEDLGYERSEEFYTYSLATP